MIYNSLSTVSYDLNRTGEINRSNILSMVTTNEANFSDLKKTTLMDENAHCFLRSPQQRATISFEQQATQVPKTTKIKQETFNDESQKQQQQKICKKCHLPIDDRYLYNVKDGYWHDRCLNCFQCGQALKNTCYETERGALYCRDDYQRYKGSLKCNLCDETISPEELVMRITVNINDGGCSGEKLIRYHEKCFTCLTCGKVLKQGEEFGYSNNGIYCKNEIERPIMRSMVSNNGVNYVELGTNKTNNYNNNNNSFSSSPSSMSSSSSTSSSSSSLYSSLQQPQMGVSNGNSNLFSPNYQYSTNSKQGLPLGLNKVGGCFMQQLHVQATPNNNNNNTNSNSSFNSFQSEEDTLSLEGASGVIGESMKHIQHGKQQRPCKIKVEPSSSSTMLNGIKPTIKRVKGIKRPRTILNPEQRKEFHAAFEASKKPSRKIREELALRTGLTSRVVQVWFQNERAKEKKLQRRKNQQQNGLIKSNSCSSSTSSSSSSSLNLDKKAKRNIFKQKKNVKKEEDDNDEEEIDSEDDEDEENSSFDEEDDEEEEEDDDDEDEETDEDDTDVDADAAEEINHGGILPAEEKLKLDVEDIKIKIENSSHHHLLNLFNNNNSGEILIKKHNNVDEFQSPDVPLKKRKQTDTRRALNTVNIKSNDLSFIQHNHHLNDVNNNTPNENIISLPSQYSSYYPLGGVDTEHILHMEDPQQRHTFQMQPPSNPLQSPQFHPHHSNSHLNHHHHHPAYISTPIDRMYSMGSDYLC